jgi:hypothetical protein
LDVSRLRQRTPSRRCHRRARRSASSCNRGLGVACGARSACAQWSVRMPNDDLRPIQPAAKSSSTIASAFAACSVTRRIARPKTARSSGRVGESWRRRAPPGWSTRHRAPVGDAGATENPHHPRAEVDVGAVLGVEGPGCPRSESRRPEWTNGRMMASSRRPSKVLGVARPEQLAKVLRRRERNRCLLDVRRLSFVGDER